MKIEYKAVDLCEFVKTVDEMGGVASDSASKFFPLVRFNYETMIDVNLDPYGDCYLNQQLNLYREISGRDIDQESNELTFFDINQHSISANAYGLRDPSNFVLHHMRIAKTIRKANLPTQPRALDMGAGWGMTSEFIAHLGADVVAVDINPQFVELIKKRAARLGLPITAICAGFDENLEAMGNFDLVLFYESMHHSIKPWSLIERCANRLKPSGKFAFAAEPIQEIWWPSWGLRLDPISVYCIRKFGWFESGWSRSFLIDMFKRARLDLELWDDDEPGVGLVGVAAFQVGRIDARALKNGWLGEGWREEASGFTAKGSSTINVKSEKQVALHIENHRGKPVSISIHTLDRKFDKTYSIIEGISEIILPANLAGKKIFLISEQWIPAEELMNGDYRVMSFTLTGLSFIEGGS